MDNGQPRTSRTDVGIAAAEELSFGLLKRRFEVCWFHSNEEMEMAVHKRLRIQHSNLYSSSILRPVQNWEECIELVGNYVTNNDASVK